MNRLLAIIVGGLATAAFILWLCVGASALRSSSGARVVDSGAGRSVARHRSRRPRKEEEYSPLRSTIRATFCRNVSVTTWKSGELKRGLAILAIWHYADRRFHGCYWMGPSGTLYAANGDAKTYSPGLPWAPVGIDYYSVMAAARYGLVDGAKRAMRARAQATLDAAKAAEATEAEPAMRPGP